MSDNTGIEWTDATWNPLVGCTKVSPGCDHCYAENLVNRFAGTSAAFPTRFDTVTIRDDKFLTQPLRWAKPRRVFVNSLSDLFHKDVPDEFIAKVFAVMAMAPQHTFQLLTKRHARMKSLLNSAGFSVLLWAAMVDLAAARTKPNVLGIDFEPVDWPLPNVWLGVSVEDQHWANLRIPALLHTPAAVRFISAEPLLGHVDLWSIDGASDLDWVIVGGESGKGARPMHPRWARSLRKQCEGMSVPFLFKQWGNWAPVEDADDWRNCRQTDHHVRFDGYHWPLDQPHGAEDGTDVLMRNVGKHKAGRELDGRLHDGYPAVSS